MAENIEKNANTDSTKDTMPQLKLLSDQGLNDFYKNIRMQLNLLFYINIAICVIAFAAIIVGVILLFLSRIEAGVVTIIASVLSEAAVMLFTKQYEKIFTFTADKFSELVLYDNMAIIINCILGLPEQDDKGQQLRYLEFRMNVRPIMEAYAKKIGLNAKMEKAEIEK